MKAFSLMMPSLLLSAAARQRDVKAEIAEAGRKFISAFNRGDAAAIAPIYSDRATVLAPGMDRIDGRANIQEFYHDTIKNRGAVVAVRDVSIVQRGELCYEVGCRSVTELNSPSPSVTQSRKYVRIWRITHSGSEIGVDIWIG